MEKRFLSNGTLDASFGVGGVIEASGGSEIAIDGDYLYLVGPYPCASKGCPPNGVIEKRFLATGVLVTNFGNGGVISGAHMDYNTRALVVFGENMYIAGEGVRDPARLHADGFLRIEKRSTATGALVTSFGSGGVIEVSGKKYYSRIQMVRDNTHLYIISFVSSEGSAISEVRIEKRSLVTGALDLSFGTSGVVSVYGGNYAQIDIAKDNTHLYFIHHGIFTYTGGYDGWILEKRSLSTGELDATFGSEGKVLGGIVSSEVAYAKVLAVGNSSLYIGGEKLSDWRIEKRSLATGALDVAFGTKGIVETTSYSYEVNTLVLDDTYLYIGGDNDSGRMHVEKRYQGNIGLPTHERAVPAPYDLTAQWGVDGTGLYNQNVEFNYDSSFISQVKAFRFYQKRPGASAFSEIATFNNPSSIYRDCSAQAFTQESLNKSFAVGSWQLYHLCTPDFKDFWTLNKIAPSVEPASAFPAGQYDFYITVLDASGREAAVSPIASQYALEQSKILSPAPGDSPSDVTTLRWTVPSDWPRNFAYYVIEIFEDTPAGQVPLYVKGIDIDQANTRGEFSLSYNGPKLDPAKMYTILIQEGSDIIQKELPNAKNPTGVPYQSYISMSIPVRIGAPLPSPPVSKDIPEGALIRARGDIDIWIVKYVGSPSTGSLQGPEGPSGPRTAGQAKKFKRLILSPTVFNSYGHLRWEDVIEVEKTVVDSFTTSDLVRADGDAKIYRLFPQSDTGIKRWIPTVEIFLANAFDWDAVYTINTTDRDAYLTGERIDT